jgi:hypothetical protein
MTANAVITLDEPVRWGVLLLFDGEVLGNARDLYPSEGAARARAAELRRRFPRHEIRLIRRTVVWTEESPHDPIRPDHSVGVVAHRPARPSPRRAGRRYGGTVEAG